MEYPRSAGQARSTRECCPGRRTASQLLPPAVRLSARNSLNHDAPDGCLLRPALHWH